MTTSVHDRVSALYRENLRLLGRDDVVVPSYGGSGQAIIGNVLLELGLNYVDPYSEALHPDGSSSPATEHAPYRRRLAGLDARDRAESAQPVRRRPRFVKSHLPAEVFAERPLLGVWILVRDPRDALYSWYEWRNAFAEEPWDLVEGSFDDFLGGPDFSGNLPAEDWRSFYVGWERRAASCAVSAVTRFEDIKRDGVGTFRSALARLGLEPAEDDLARAVERSTFDAMRAHEDSVAESAARMVRSGRAEGWRSWITPPLASRFAADDLRLVAGRYGYELGPGLVRR